MHAIERVPQLPRGAFSPLTDKPGGLVVDYIAIDDDLKRDVEDVAIALGIAISRLCEKHRATTDKLVLAANAYESLSGIPIRSRQQHGAHVTETTFSQAPAHLSRHRFDWSFAIPPVQTVSTSASLIMRISRHRDCRPIFPPQSEPLRLLGVAEEAPGGDLDDRVREAAVEGGVCVQKAEVERALEEVDRHLYVAVSSDLATLDRARERTASRSGLANVATVFGCSDWQVRLRRRAVLTPRAAPRSADGPPPSATGAR